MRILTTIILIIGIVACQQFKHPKKVQSNLTLFTEDFNYTTYSWYFPSGQWEFYVNHFLHIDKNGHFSLMLRDSTSKPRFFKGTINDTIRNLINQTFSVDTFNNDYKSEALQNIAYSGYTFCFDYVKENESRKRIVFIQIRSPKLIETLSTKFDKILQYSKAQQVDTISIASYVRDLKKYSATLLGPAPRLEAPKLNPSNF